VAAWDDDDAMHRDVCRRDGTCSVIMVDTCRKLQPHLETNHVGMKRLFQGTRKVLSNQIAVLLFSAVPGNDMQVPSPPLEAT
jgi:hypothetical protein